MQHVLAHRPVGAADERAVGLPGVRVHRDLPAITTGDACEAVGAIRRIGNAKIGPAGGHVGAQLDRKVARRGRSIGRRGAHDGNQVRAAIAHVEMVGHVVWIAVAVDEEVRLVVFKDASCLHHADHLVDGHLIDEREVGFTQAVEVLKRRLVVDEQSLERGGEKPAPDADLAGIDAPEVRRERRRQAAARDFGGDDLEVDQQPALVLDDLRLAGDDADVLCFAPSGVPHHDGEAVGNRGLDDVARERIIREHVALVEIFNPQTRVRKHCDGRGGERNLQARSAEAVAEHAADEVNRRSFRRGLRGWDEDEGRAARGIHTEGTGPVHRTETGHHRRTLAEAFRHVTTFGVEHLHAHEDVGQRRHRIAVDEFERRVEGIASHHEILLDAQCDPGAHAIAAGGLEGAACRRHHGRRGHWNHDPVCPAQFHKSFIHGGDQLLLDGLQDFGALQRRGDAGGKGGVRTQAMFCDQFFRDASARLHLDVPNLPSHPQSCRGHYRRLAKLEFRHAVAADIFEADATLE